MKAHISATIEKKLLERADRFGSEERRSRSQVIELALEHFLREHALPQDEIVVTKGRFAGNFSRAETYDR